MKNIILIIASIFISLHILAQSNEVEVVAKGNCNELSNDVFIIDIYLKALNAGEQVTINEQNYRFDYNTAAISNPSIVTTTGGLGYSNPVFSDNGNISFFSAPTLTGSLSNLISFNIEMAGGDGLPLTHTVETYIGSIAFDVIDLDLAYNFNWHHFVGSEDNWPPTYIGIQNMTEDATGIFTDEVDFDVTFTTGKTDRSGFTNVTANTSSNETYTYLWDDGTIGNVKPNACKGNDHTVTITNASACSKTFTYQGQLMPSFNGRLGKPYPCANTFTVLEAVEGPFILGGGKLGDELNQVNVYPNPANQQITVDLENIEFETGTVEIYDLAGKQVQMERLSSNQSMVHLNVGALIGGVYIVKIHTNERVVHTQKLTITH